ncbi:MAG: hypothetical protein E7Z91_03630 [Cyanobacteria bacterium SIG30]|nr:hypothetical protein [Cyanobacteria bacterium SIG30]
MSNLSLITSGYSNLNGLGNALGGYGYYGGYGYGGFSGAANAEEAKDRIANNYDVFATQQSYRNKQGVESINYEQQCALLYETLKNGEIDKASESFEEMVNQMKNSSQYASCSDAEIRALIRSQYATTTGSDLISDINKNASSALVQGLKRGVPILGLFAEETSEADMKAQVTGTDKTKSEKIGKVFGTVTGAGAGVAGLATAGLAIKRSKGGLLNKIKNLPFVKNNKGFIKTTGIVAIGVAALSGLCAIFGGNDKKAEKA